MPSSGLPIRGMHVQFVKHEREIMELWKHALSAEGLSSVSNSLKFVVQKRRQIHNLATIRIH